MADIDKAIDAADQAELKVENKDKSIEVSVPEDNEIDLSNFETQEDGTITFGSVLTPDIQEEFTNIAGISNVVNNKELQKIFAPTLTFLDYAF